MVSGLTLAARAPHASPSLSDRNPSMSSRYDAADIEVLSGLDPVKRRPGMYTDTTRPNHLVQEVVDNSVDEALSGYASSIDVVLHEDGSVEVSDDGAGIDVGKVRAVALARSIFLKGASFVAAMVFELASTNLVIELGIILVVLLGWSFAAAMMAIPPPAISLRNRHTSGTSGSAA